MKAIDPRLEIPISEDSLQAPFMQEALCFVYALATRYIRLSVITVEHFLRLYYECNF